MRLLLIAALLAAPVTADAGPGGRNFGVGLMLGEPSGLSAKLFVDRRHAFDAALSFSFVDDRFHAHGDYLLHFPGKIQGLEGGQWIPYVGIGGKLRFREDDKDSGHDGLSARIPLGVVLHPQGMPVDFFVEIVPGMRVLPETDPELGGAIGARFYF